MAAADPTTEISVPGYRIDRVIGTGGMGVVYKAMQLALDREVAIKVLPKELAQDANFVASFAREARTAAKLHHPNIVSVIDFGHLEGSYYIVMQYVEGRTLNAIMAFEPLPIKRVLAITNQIATALDYAHSQEVVHRDIKPSNIMIRSDGTAMIMDFGVACGAHPSDQSGWGAIGTPTYMSPEQCKRSKGSPRSDQYSLAVTVYEMLAGRPPFLANEPVEMMRKHVQDQPPSMRRIKPEVTEQMEAALFRALSKLPEVRFESVKAFADELLAGLQQRASHDAPLGPPQFTQTTTARPGAPVQLTAPEPQRPSPPPRTVHHHPVIVTYREPLIPRWIWIVAILAIIAGAAAAFLLRKPAEPAAGPPVKKGNTRKVKASLPLFTIAEVLDGRSTSNDAPNMTGQFLHPNGGRIVNG